MFDARISAPLEFFRQDSISGDNRELLEKENQRYRLLSPMERFKLWRYVVSLRRELRRARYNDLVAKRQKLWNAYLKLYEAHQATEDESERRKIRRMIRSCARQGKVCHEKIVQLSETAGRYQHYLGWLEYEARNRGELKAEAKREKLIRRQMRQESKWLESLLLDVFRKTSGCHHISTDGKGREITRIPKFERAQITPDAHYFWLAASRKTLFGYRWLLPYSVNISRLTHDETIANMRAATKRDVAAVWSQQGQLIFRVSRLDSPDALPSLVKWRDTRAYYPDEKRDKLPYTIGVGENRKFRWLDFATEPHILVAGKSQSGKSNLVNGIIATNVATHSPDELRLVLIDQKGGIEFTHWNGLPHLLWNVAKTVEDVKPVLQRVVLVMKKRMELLEKARKKDLAAYNATAAEKLPRLMVIIDEMNTFVGLGQTTEDIHNLIMLIVSQGRACGIHMITATQHPEVKVIPGRIKTNMAVRICGAMPSVMASQIVLDQADAAHLPSIPGRFVAVCGLKTWQVQVPRIDDQDIAQVVAKARNDYPDRDGELPELTTAPLLKVWDQTAVIEAALAYADGSLSGQRISRLLGSESPGERYLNTQCKRIVDAGVAAGGKIQHQGKPYSLVKWNKGYRLISPDSDDQDVSTEEESVSEPGLTRESERDTMAVSPSLSVVTPIGLEPITY